MSEGPALKDGARLDRSGIAGWFELMCQSTWSLRAPCSNPLVHSLRPCRETPVGHKEKQKYICCSLPGSRLHRCFGKLLLCFVFFPLLSKTETFKAWKNQQPPFLLPGAEEAVCDAANARYRKHNRSWCRPRRRPLALRICFCHESRMLAAVYGLGRYISPGPRIIFSG